MTKKMKAKLKAKAAGIKSQPTEAPRKKRRPRVRDQKAIIHNHTNEARTIMERMRTANGQARFIYEHRFNLLINHSEFPANFNLL